jgi:hypothetical protein
MGSLGKLHIMRIVGFDENILTYEWANIWRDTCFRPGGTCTASCSCPGGN